MSSQFNFHLDQTDLTTSPTWWRILSLTQIFMTFQASAFHNAARRYIASWLPESYRESNTHCMTSISFVMFVSQSVRPHVTTRLPMKGFLWSIFRKSVQKIQVSLKSDMNSGHSTWRRMYICDNISLTSSQNKKFLDKCCRENTNTHF